MSNKSVKEGWIELCRLASIDDGFSSSVWNTIETLYNEDHRYYHTLIHIQRMLDLSTQYEESIQDKLVVNLAIVFHDIIYNPKSGTNEEDSITLFEDLLSSRLPATTVAAVRTFILATKSHSLPYSSDHIIDGEMNDLKLFLDLDMEVLSREPEQYAEYAANIRKEYIHVDPDVYCEKRAIFLSQIISSGKRIYCSDHFASREEIAIRNLEWECRLLANKIIPTSISAMGLSDV